MRTLAEASQAPDTNDLMSGATERLMTSPVCPLKDVVCCPVSMSHNALKQKKGRDILLKTRKCFLDVESYFVDF